MNASSDFVKRSGGLRVLLALVLAMSFLFSGWNIAPAQAADNVWTHTGHMSAARTHHTATLLLDGRVLVAGGANALGALTSAELYNPVTGTWTSTGSMQTGRSRHTATLLPDGRVLVAGGANTDLLGLSGAEIYDPLTGTWSATGGLTFSRFSHTASLLSDGRVLVAGGTSGALYPSSAESYNPTTGVWTLTNDGFSARARHAAVLYTASGGAEHLLSVGGYDGSSYPITSQYYDMTNWTSTFGLEQGRADHTVTRLPDGQLLAVGGYNGVNYLTTSEVRTPTTDWAFTTGSMSYARANHTATLLPDGRVLVVGGYDGSASVVRTEIFNPASGAWVSAGDLNQGRKWHTTTLLADGRVLVVGGWQFGQLSSAEIRGYTTPNWTSAAAMSTTRTDHAATLLPDGRVLVAGGRDNGGLYLRTAGVYVPDTNTWEAAVGQMTDYRSNHTLTLLPNGRALVAGGRNATASLNSSQVFYPNALMWHDASTMNYDRHDHTATLLPNGSVLVTGGSYLATPIPGYRSSAELYNPTTNQWTTTGSMSEMRTRHTATLLPNGQVLMVGGYKGGATLTSYVSAVELYDSASGVFTPTAALSPARADHTATLLPDGRVLVVGGVSRDISGQIYLTSCQIYTPSSGTWSAAGDLPLGRADHTATLLADGRVLVTGGQGSGGMFSSALLYDPATNVWTVLTNTMAAARYNHTATLLPSGQLFVAGGQGANVWATTERYDRGLGQVADWRPSIASATSPLLVGQSLALTGSGFRGVSQGSGGNGHQDSSTGYPLVQLRRLDNEQMRWLQPGAAFSDTAFTTSPVVDWHPGHAMVTVFTNGIPSMSRVILLTGVSHRIYLPLVLR